MEKSKKGLLAIWVMFGVFFCLFVSVTFGTTRIMGGATSTMWLILALLVTFIAIGILIKNKLPSKRYIAVSLVLGIVLFVALAIVHNGSSFSAIQTSLVATICSLAAFSVFEEHQVKAIRLLRSTKVKPVLLTLAIGLLVGVVLGILNLSMGSGEPDLQLRPKAFLFALSPGVYEEIAFRAFIFAACLFALRGELNTRFQKFTCWFMMIVPHVLIHTPDMFIEGGIESGISATIILSLLFGAPFAVLQRKRDLVSAMLAHWMVMVISFSAFGYPGVL